MNQHRWTATFLIACVLYLSNPFFVTGEILDPTPEVSAFARGAPNFDSMKLAEIALAFSGVEPAKRGEYIERIRMILNDVKRTVDPQADAYSIGEYILEYLHERVFIRYLEPQTRLDVTLDTGTYNCVSSSVLYFVVARSFDLPVLGTVTPDHAFCTVQIGSRAIDVETTSRHGFDPGRKKEFHDEFGNLTGYSYVSPTNRGKRTSAGERELIALILHNRMSESDANQNYLLALELAVDRHAFVDSYESLADLDREVSNYVAMLNSKNEFEAAVDILERMFFRYGARESLIGVYRGVSHNLALSLINNGEYQAARSVLDRFRTGGYNDAAKIRELETLAIRHELANVLPNLDVEDAFAYVEAVRASTRVAASVYREFLVNLYFRSAEAVAAVDGFLSAVAVVDRAIEEIGTDGNLERARSVYRFNYTVVVHNLFAETFNARKYEQALRIVVDALAHVPESDILADDLNMVRKTIDTER